MQRDYYRMNRKQQQFALAELDRVQSEVAGMLATLSGPDGKIQRQRFTRIQREFLKIEQQIRKTGEIVINDIVADSADFATSGIQDRFGDVFGAQFLPPATLAQVNDNVVEYVTKRFYEDGLVLSDRIWTASSDIRMAVEQEIRMGILTGMSVSEMIPRVRKAWDAETWQIRRLVVTEGSTAYRTATAMSAERSDVVDWVQMHRGLADRPNHYCTVLSKEDRYGEGAGIFKPTDSEIYNPHPNCTGFVTYVVNDDYSLEGLKKRFGDQESADTDTSKIDLDTYDLLNDKDVYKFRGNESANKFFENNIGNYTVNMTEEQQKAIHSYTDNTYDFVNDMLRKGVRSPDDSIHDRYMRQIEDIKEAISTFKLEKPIQVFRVVDKRVFEGVDDYYSLRGATITDKGFVSTSVLQGQFDNNKPIEFIINVPAGTGHGAYVDHISEYKGKEYEFLMQADSQFLITEVYTDEWDTKYIMEMELVPDGKRKSKN